MEFPIIGHIEAGAKSERAFKFGLFSKICGSFLAPVGRQGYEQRRMKTDLSLETSSSEASDALSTS